MEEKTFFVTLYLETKLSNFSNFPCKFQITHWVKKFKETETLIKFTKKGHLSEVLESSLQDCQRILTHSLDSTLLYFYLWGFLKDYVNQNNPQTIAKVKEAITQQIYGIAREECVRVINNFALWLQIWHHHQREHLEHVL